MASTIDINLDRSGGLLAGGSCPFATLPELTRNDQYIVRLRVLERNSTGNYTDSVLSSPSFKMGIGSLGSEPTSGEFKLTIGATTSSAISYNATTTQVLTAISGIAGNVIVQSYGNSGSGWLVTAATANTALSFGGISYTLFPTSSVLINTRRNPGTDIKAQQVIELSRNPAVFSDTFTAVSGDVLALNKIQDGSATQNEVYELTVGNDVLGGSFSLAYGGYSISSNVGNTAVSLNSQLTAITGIGVGNLDVKSNSKRGYVFTFVNQLGLQNVSTALILDSTGIISPKYYQTTLTMGTVQLDELFVEADSDTIKPSFEIEITESGRNKTLLQTPVSVRRDLIATGSAVPSPQASYYTKSEANALFVEDSSGNVDATNRILCAADSSYSVDYNGRSLLDEYYNQIFSWSNARLVLQGSSTNIQTVCIGFFGSTAITKPSGTNIVSGLTNLGLISYTQPTAVNVVSGLINAGLIANGATYGVLPRSPRTVTTLTSVTFGTLASNDQHYRDVVVTGAEVNDIVLIGLPSAISAGAIIQGVVYQTNTVCLSCVNADNVPRDVNTATYRITVIGY
jgi:hypothetical protein